MEAGTEAILSEMDWKDWGTVNQILNTAVFKEYTKMT